MSVKSWVIGKVVDHEVGKAKKEGKMKALWRFLDGKKSQVGGALSALALLATFVSGLAPIAQGAFGEDSQVVVYVVGTAGVLTWLVGAAHKAWKLYYHEEHQ